MIKLRRAILYDLTAYIFLIFLSSIIVFYFYVGDVPGGSDWPTHLSNIRFIADNLPHIPRWYSERGLGEPFISNYPPFSFYLAAFLKWFVNTNVFEACKLHFILILSIGAISTYVLAYELGIKRVGCLASGVLLLGSYNIYSWWWIGQLPNMTAVMFTPLALLGFLIAVRKQTLFAILIAGLLYAPVILSHLLNAIILGVILIVTSIFMIILRPELFYISRGPMQPPIYTFRLPKILLISLLEAFAVSAWWYLPFIPRIFDVFAWQAGYGAVSTGESAKALALNINFLLNPSLYYAGVGHLILALSSFVLLVKRRHMFHNFGSLPFIWFISFIFGSVSPYFGIPMGLPFRFGPYLTISEALLGGLVIQILADYYRYLLKKFKFLTAIFILLLLSCISFPSVMEAKDDFLMIKKAGIPTNLEALSEQMKNGERLGTSSINWINVFTDIWQTYGGMISNEFSYKFWYFMFANKTAERLPFFAKNFNVKYFLGGPVGSPYLRKIDSGIYEVVNIDTSLVETTEGKLLILFIGEEEYYIEYFFLSISQTESLDILLAYGGKFLEDIDPAILRRFNSVYLSGLYYRNMQAFTSMLQDYLDSGGGVILESLEPDDVPPLFPVSKTLATNASFNLTITDTNEVMRGVDLISFSRYGSEIQIIYAQELRQGANTILSDGDNPIIVGWNYSHSKVLWSGLNLPYLAMLQGNIEASKMLTQMLRYVSSSPNAGKAKGSFSLETERIIINVKDASTETGVWIKINYDPRWTANINGQGCRIIKAGAGMMLVFPMRDDDYTIEIVLGKSLLEQYGEIATIVGLIMIPASLLVSNWKIPKGWTKTRHVGSDRKRELDQDNDQ
ncbi:MAG: 6-pyruvoyl-tetrahydropterin synthase-related protein [Candidatus Bathyarchaeia archaeon]